MKKSDRSRKTPAEMVTLWGDWAKRYPIVSLEDGMGEEDRDGWKALTKALGKKLQLVGDDNFVTNPRIFAEGIRDGIANAILIKLNQIGTVSETLEGGDGAEGRLWSGDFASVGRNGGRFHCGPGGRDWRGANQDRVGLPVGAHCQVQSAAGDRARVGEEGALRRDVMQGGQEMSALAAG
jgi:hypothetical protein